MNRSKPLRFSLDSSLARLARWLRLLGHDAAAQPDWTIRQALNAARTERRILLTRSSELDRLGLSPPEAGYQLVRSDRVEDQLVEVGRRWPVFQRQERFSRCSECNDLLELADTVWARSRVPPYVAATQEQFRVCPRCGRIYWSATHTDQITRFFHRLEQRVTARRTEETKSPGETKNRGAGPVSADPTPRDIRPEGTPSP